MLHIDIELQQRKEKMENKQLWQTKESRQPNFQKIPNLNLDFSKFLVPPKFASTQADFISRSEGA